MTDQIVTDRQVWNSACGDIVIETLADGTVLVNGDPVTPSEQEHHQSPTPGNDDDKPAE